MKVDFNTSYNCPQFGRKPTATEMKTYTKSVKEGLKVLNKEIGLILHNSSAASSKGSNYGIGSLFSKTTQLAFMPFIAAHAYSTIQQEPDNIRGPFKPSPYIPISSSKNIYMIPLEKLASEEYDNILEESDLDDIYYKNYQRKNPNKVDYKFIYENYTKLTDKAYDNYCKKLQNNTISEALFEDHMDFRIKNYDELEANAIYEILVLKNKDEDWKQWKNEAHRNLYSDKYKKELEALKQEHKKDIEKHIFKQWIIHKETENSKIINEKHGLRIIGDSPVAPPTAEVWRNQDLYFDNISIGCPPDGNATDGQRWGFAALKPETIFNPDGTLGPGGELMKKRYEKMFESSPGGVRIDHIIGLIDPFVYSMDKPNMDYQYASRLYSSEGHPLFGKYAKHSEEEYAAILQKIVIPAAEKYGLTKEDIICEDLGTVTEPVQKIMNNMELSGIAVSQWDYRGKEQNENKVMMLGSHDNQSFIEYTDRMFSEQEAEHLENKSAKLAEDTASPNQDIKKYREEIKTNKQKFMAASFAELFTSPVKKIQIFFTDFFGIGETYNQPGKEDGCWALRLPSDFEDVYYKSVKEGNAINLPEAIATAIRHKGKGFANKNSELLENLDTFTKILKE